MCIGSLKLLEVIGAIKNFVHEVNTAYESYTVHQSVYTVTSISTSLNVSLIISFTSSHSSLSKPHPILGIANFVTLFSTQCCFIAISELRKVSYVGLWKYLVFVTCIHGNISITLESEEFKNHLHTKNHHARAKIKKSYGSAGVEWQEIMKHLQPNTNLTHAKLHLKHALY